MHKKITYFVLASSFLLSSLASCGSSSTSDTANSTESEKFDVTFHHQSDETKNVKVEVTKGQTVYTALNGDLSKVTSLCESDTLHFDNWFTSSEAAAKLNYGENNENLYKYDLIIESSLDLYPGFALDGFDSKLNSYISDYLGAYHKAKTSPVPFLRTNAFHVDTNEENVFYFDNASAYKFKEYKNDLVELYDFKEVSDNKYLDKLEAYTLSLEHLAASSSIKVTMNFNDEAGKFPSKFFASNFPAIDSSYYINDDDFSLSENSKDEDLSKKYITAVKADILSGNEIKRSIFYTPKADDSNPTSSLSSFLTGKGIFQAINSNGTTMIDMFGNTLITITKVSKFEASNYASEGVKEGMMAIHCQELYTEENDVEGLKEYFKELTGKEFPTDLFFNIEGGTAYGTLLGYTVNNSLPAVGQHISGVSKASFDAWLEKEKQAGMSIASSSSTSATYLSTFVGTSSNGEYVFKASFYDSSKLSDLSQNVVQILFYRNQSVYEKLANWFELNNVGGGTITSVPELPATSVTSGNLNTGSSTLYYGYYLRGSGVEQSEFDAYKESLVSEGWKETTKEGDEYLSFLSKDGYYSLALIYDADSKVLLVQIIYNAIRTTTSLEAALSFIGPRFGLETLVVPGLQELYDKETTKPQIEVAQYYNKSEHRGYMVFTLDSSEKVNTYLTTVESKLASDAAFTYVGANSNGIKFYQDKTNGHIIYAADVSDTSGETPVYQFIVGVYKEI